MSPLDESYCRPFIGPAPRPTPAEIYAERERLSRARAAAIRQRRAAEVPAPFRRAFAEEGVEL